MRYLPLALLSIAASAHAAIYQCGNSFQGTPCQGAIVRSGAPTTDNDQSGARYAGPTTHRQQGAPARASTYNRQACTDARRELSKDKRTLAVYREKYGIGATNPIFTTPIRNEIDVLIPEVAQYCH